MSRILAILSLLLFWGAVRADARSYSALTVNVSSGGVPDGTYRIGLGIYGGIGSFNTDSSMIQSYAKDIVVSGGIASPSSFYVLVYRRAGLATPSTSRVGLVNISKGSASFGPFDYTPGYDVSWNINGHASPEDFAIDVSLNTVKKRTVSFDYRIDNKDDSELPVRLLIDGVSRNEFTVSGGAQSAGDVSLELAEGQSGVFTWQVLAGGEWVTVMDGSYRVATVEIPGVDPAELNFVRQKVPPPDPEPTPTPPPGNGEGQSPPTPKPTPPASEGGGSQRDVIRGGGGGTNGEMQKEDIYDAVKAALEDASYGKEPLPEDDVKVAEVSKEDIESVTDQLPALKDGVEEMADRMTDTVDHVLSQLEALKTSVYSMEQTFGKKTSVYLGSFPVVGSLTVDFSFLPLNLIRSILLWILYVWFVYNMCKIWIG